MKWLTLVYILMADNQVAFASGDAHGSATISSLAFPVFNFVIFVGFLTWKLKPSISLFFQERSKKIAHGLQHAQVKSQEAKIKQSQMEDKLKGLDRELAKIQAENREIIKKWENKLVHETDERILKAKADANNRLEAEKQEMVVAFKQAFVSRVVEGTKSSLHNNNQIATKAGSKIIEGLRE